MARFALILAAAGDGHVLPRHHDSLCAQVHARGHAELVALGAQRVIRRVARCLPELGIIYIPSSENTKLPESL